MYNRYIPQPDGSYRRSRIADPEPKPRPEPPTPQPYPEPIPTEPSCGPEQSTPRPPCRSCRRKPHPPKPEPRGNSDSIGAFLGQLLPKNFDSGDLLVVILLLLMSRDCADDQNTALLTLALYLFM